MFKRKYTTPAKYGLRRHFKLNDILYPDQFLACIEICNKCGELIAHIDCDYDYLLIRKIWGKYKVDYITINNGIIEIMLDYKGPIP